MSPPPGAVTPLDPARYRRLPWKNGGGVSVDIAWDAETDGETWRFGRTPIVAAGPFSDYSGNDRLQVLVAGQGLVLQAPDGEIDVRQPFRPVRFAGEIRITSRLEHGPVEVVNLIGQRARVRLDLAVLRAGESRALAPGRTLVYCADGPATVRVGGSTHALPADGGLDLSDVEGTLACTAGLVVVGSVACA